MATFISVQPPPPPLHGLHVHAVQKAAGPQGVGGARGPGGPPPSCPPPPGRQAGSPSMHHCVPGEAGRRHEAPGSDSPGPAPDVWLRPQGWKGLQSPG
ncbi:basic proline-rich protein-like isoform X3 [Poecilia formosa]|uniref:basic proline-rich protein-like isoform X3 n=1 Tax=Poecilia formosa TaxID=48698 RepID=UPI0007B95CBF|nr:PREDICTED: basic proline-rich protein-like isoform X3 [Poecilia formosa]